jgi:hypothetical protein
VSAARSDWVPGPDGAIEAKGDPFDWFVVGTRADVVTRHADGTFSSEACVVVRDWRGRTRLRPATRAWRAVAWVLGLVRRARRWMQG